MRGTAVGFVLVLAMISPATAAAIEFAPGYAGTDFVTGFPSGEPSPPLGSPVGPWGLDFDADGTLFVADRFDRNLYAFGPAGGVAGPEALRGPLDDYIAADLAFDAAGRLFTARSGPVFDIVEIRPQDGQVIRSLTTLANEDYVKGMKVDPLSGDLFALVFRATTSTSFVLRVSLPPSGAGTATPYATFPGTTQADGLVFTRGGTMFAVTDDDIHRIAGTDQPQPAAMSKVATVPTADGMAVDQSSDARNPGHVVVNRNDGKITRVDFTPDGPQYTDIVTGGGRGDSATVGPDGCLYATQTSSVLKVTRADGTCALAPFTPFPPDAVTAGATGVGTTEATLTGTVDPNGYETGARFELGAAPGEPGGSTPEQPVGHGTDPVAVSARATGLQPGTTYRFRVVGTSSFGVARGAVVEFTTAPAAPAQPLAASTTPAPLPPPAPPAARVVNPLPPAKGCVSRRRFRIRLRVPRGARVTRANVSVNGRRVRVVRSDRLRALVNLKGLPKGRFTVRITLVLHDGRRVTGTRRYRTCTPRRRSAT